MREIWEKVSEFLTQKVDFLFGLSVWVIGCIGLGVLLLLIIIIAVAVKKHKKTKKAKSTKKAKNTKAAKNTKNGISAKKEVEPVVEKYYQNNGAAASRVTFEYTNIEDESPVSGAGEQTDYGAVRTESEYEKPFEWIVGNAGNGYADNIGNGQTGAFESQDGIDDNGGLKITESDESPSEESFKEEYQSSSFEDSINEKYESHSFGDSFRAQLYDAQNEAKAEEMKVEQKVAAAKPAAKTGTKSTPETAVKASFKQDKSAVKTTAKPVAKDKEAPAAKPAAKQDKPAVKTTAKAAAKDKESAVKPAVKAAPKQDKPAVKSAAKPAAKDIKPATAKVAAKSTAATKTPVKAEPQKESPAVKGKYVISKQNTGKYIFSLLANNGIVLFESEEYAAMTGARSGIETFKKYIVNEAFDVIKTEFGDFTYIIKRSNGSYVSRPYENENAAKAAAASVRKFYDTDNIVIKQVLR